MNADTLKGNWKELKGKIVKKWSKLTDDDMGEVAGDLTILEGKLQEAYGLSKEEVEKELRQIQ